MPIGNLGFTEILIILLLVLLLFGAKRLPEIGASMGKGIREFKKSVTEVDRSLREPEREDRSERLRAAEPAARSREGDESTSEPKRLMS
jgi:sec-independent protein translocase protein TatA